MIEKLTIRNFGPIINVELEIRQFTILIGEQATGKSTVAKLLCVCRYFSYLINTQFVIPIENQFLNGLTAWGLASFLDEKSEIIYTCKDYTLEAKYHQVKRQEIEEDGITRRYEEKVFFASLSALSPEFQSLVKKLEGYKPTDTDFDGFGDLFLNIPPGFFQSEVNKIMDYPFYLPAERGLQSIFSLGKTSIQNITDSLFNQFANIDLIARKFGQETNIEPLGIVYKNIDGRGFFRKKDTNQFLSLYSAATGYQSTIPVVLSLKYYSTIRKKKKTFVIEEPEENLFPTAQNELIKFIVKEANLFGHSILVTTHSPYILTSLNNLLFAYQAGLKSSQVSKVLESAYWLNKENLSIFKMNQDGTCSNIFDEESGLTKAEIIDSVSDTISAELSEIIKAKYEE